MFLQKIKNIHVEIWYLHNKKRMPWLFFSLALTIGWWFLWNFLIYTIPVVRNRGPVAPKCPQKDIWMCMTFVCTV